jgi:hypothetical protein
MKFLSLVLSRKVATRYIGIAMSIACNTFMRVLLLGLLSTIGSLADSF